MGIKITFFNITYPVLPWSTWPQQWQTCSYICIIYKERCKNRKNVKLNCQYVEVIHKKVRALKPRGSNNTNVCFSMLRVICHECTGSFQTDLTFGDSHEVLSLKSFVFIILQARKHQWQGNLFWFLCTWSLLGEAFSFVGFKLMTHSKSVFCKQTKRFDYTDSVFHCKLQHTRTLTVKVCTSNNFTFVKYTVIKQSRRFDVFIIVDLPQMIKPVNWLFSFITVTIMWSYSWAFDFQGICSFMNKLFKKLSVCFMSNYNLYIVLRLQKHNIYF